jgi:hypothetical protein
LPSNCDITGLVLQSTKDAWGIDFAARPGPAVDTRQKQEFIRTKAFENKRASVPDKVLWSRHAIEKLVAERLDRSQVEVALQTCHVIEEYVSVGRPLPDCLVVGLWQGRPIHAVTALGSLW